MITIPVKVFGNYWLNPDEVKQVIQNTPQKELICLDFLCEGPSLSAVGLFSMLLESCRIMQRDPETILITNWSNAVEESPFKRKNLFVLSHFFWMSNRYANTEILPNTHEYKFGMFIGRRTGSRMFMLQDMWNTHSENCLFSLMASKAIYDPRIVRPGIDLDSQDAWVEPNDLLDFYRWCDNPPISSIDGHTVRHQYLPEHNTNQSLLKHYHRFDIEIVVETYTLGDCFLPTEKTVRPIVGMKPMLIYGPRKYLARLRDLGFRTWNQCWDESYDDLEGIERWKAIKSLISQLAQWPLAPQCQDIAEHNLSHISVLNSKYSP